MPTIVIPMSGLGKRFINKGYKDPKPLIIVDGKPIIEHIVNLFNIKNDNYIFICNDLHLRETNMRNILFNICPKSKILEVPVEGRKGPVHAVSLIFDNIPNDEEIIVSYCDYGTQWDYNNFLKDNRVRDADGSIACYRGFHPHMLGTDNYAFLKEKELGSRWMDKIQEKQPFTNNRMEEYASNGTYYFKNGKIMKKYFQKLMDLEIKVKNEYYVSMVYNLLVEDGLKVNIFEIEKMLQWGTPYDLEIYKGWSKYFDVKKQTQQKFKDKHNTSLILPLAGKGSRFVKEDYNDPKPLIDVNGFPMIVSAVKSLPETSNQVFICLEEHLKNYPLEQKIKENYNKSNIISINKVTEGQACTIELGIKKANIDLESPILVSACDNGVHFNTEKYQSLIDNNNNDIIVWSFTNQQCTKKNPEMYGWIETDDNDNVTEVSCKKFIEGVHDLEKSHVIIGTVFFRKAKYFLEGLQVNYKNDFRTNGEFYLDDVINPCVKKGLKTKVFEVDDYICWGTPDEYKTYNYWNEYFAYKFFNENVIDDKKYYDKTSVIIGNNYNHDKINYLINNHENCVIISDIKTLSNTNLFNKNINFILLKSTDDPINISIEIGCKNIIILGNIISNYGSNLQQYLFDKYNIHIYSLDGKYKVEKINNIEYKKIINFKKFIFISRINDDNYDVGALVRYFIKMHDKFNFSNKFMKNGLKIITYKNIDKYILHNNSNIKSDHFYNMLKIFHNQINIYFCFHSSGLKYIFDNNIYIKNKCIFWINDPHWFANFCKDRKENETIQLYSKKYEIKYLNKLSLIISPSTIYFKNLNMSDPKIKFLFYFINPDFCKLIKFNNYKKRENKIILSGSTGGGYKSRIAMKNLKYKNKLFDSLIYIENHPGYKNNEHMTEMNYYNKLSTFKGAFVGHYCFPLNYLLAKHIEVLMCGCLGFFEKNELLDEMGIIEFEHYIPATDNNGNLIQDINYYQYWLENGEDIALNGCNYIRDKFGFNYINEYLKILLKI